MPRFATALLAGLTVTAVTGVATLAIARDQGWTLRGAERAPGPVTIVMSRDGGPLYAGSDDAPTLHLSGILDRQGIRSVELPAFEGTDAQWTRLVGCVRERFDGLDVEIVDEIPAGGAYSLAYVGGTPDLLGYPETVGGIAPHADRVLEGSIVFVFQAPGVSDRALCETTAHEVAHTLGLDHTRDCSDIMSYESCGPKEFIARPAVCGEWDDRRCENGQLAQSSRERLASAVGTRPSRIQPVVEPRAPGDPPLLAARPSIDVRRSAEAVAGRPFSVFVDVGAHEVEHVDLFWYAQQGHRLRCGEEGPIPFRCDREGSVYTFTLYPDVAGARKFVARTTESSGRMTRTPSYRVTLGRAR